MSPIVFLISVWFIASVSTVSRVNGEDSNGDDGLYLKAGPGQTLVNQKNGRAYNTHGRGEDYCEYFPEVVIAQDVSASNAGSLQQLKQLVPELFTYFDTFYGLVRLGVTSFVDKPVGELGGKNDYCTSVNLPLTIVETNEAVQRAKNAISGLEVSGGGDYFGGANEAMFRIAASDAVGWSKGTHDKETGFPIVRFLVIFTDAPVHEPKLYTNLPSHDLVSSANRAMLHKDVNHKCAATDYPSAEDIGLVMKERGIIPIIIAGKNHFITPEKTKEHYKQYSELLKRDSLISDPWKDFDNGLVEYYKSYMMKVTGADAIVRNSDSTVAFVDILREAVESATGYRCANFDSIQDRKG